MSAHLDIEALESVALGREPDAAEREHLAQCAECARELRLLVATRALLARRPAAQVSHLWSGVQERIEKPAAPVRRIHRPRWALRAGAAAAVAAASILLMVYWHRPSAIAPQQMVAEAEAPLAGPDAKTLAALDRAETDYRDAARVLEEEYARLRPRMDQKLAARWDETLTRARSELGGARQSMVAQDVNARMRVLDGYAGYLRSLRSAVIESQEASP
jgi:hypothetical protein